MPFTNVLMERLGVSIPVIQAPMLGATDAAIVGAVSGAGAMERWRRARWRHPSSPMRSRS